MPKIPNLVYAKIHVGSVVKAGRPLALYSATETTYWKRSEDWAVKAAENFDHFVDLHSEPLPEGTAGIVLRETDHLNLLSKDKRNHLTAVCLDAEEKAIHKGTVHVSTEVGQPESGQGGAGEPAGQDKPKKDV